MAERIIPKPDSALEAKLLQDIRANHLPEPERQLHHERPMRQSLALAAVRCQGRVYPGVQDVIRRWYVRRVRT